MSIVTGPSPAPPMPHPLRRRLAHPLAAAAWTGVVILVGSSPLSSSHEGLRFLLVYDHPYTEHTALGDVTDIVDGIAPSSFHRPFDARDILTAIVTYTHRQTSFCSPLLPPIKTSLVIPCPSLIRHFPVVHRPCTRERIDRPAFRMSDTHAALSSWGVIPPSAPATK
ncbi:hypothetical protein HYPSUDRAFT_214190 [Hypholoma sublateritium FD-334 SS-4]|uniref:Uncharacterized protein n=1 Tax=Hypholoma sublateritium (strain FD-334 SS-4) TaxID=945553 RepID=A0A0D2P9G4_HYPSF|nr:hypothetical protein HYPSUDRAFT_214190 [Hypholoma sublateritium FD-334 SS-4]